MGYLFFSPTTTARMCVCDTERRTQGGRSKDAGNLTLPELLLALQLNVRVEVRHCRGIAG